MNREHRTEKHIIKRTDPYYNMLKDFCAKSKALYNHANYIIRQTFIAEGKWIRYDELDKTLRADFEYPDYKNMPTAQSAQQTLKALDANWKSFFATIKDYKEHPEKYLGRPKIPKYIKRAGFNLILPSQRCPIRNGMVMFPKAFCGFSVRPLFLDKNNNCSFKQTRFIPKKNSIVIEFVYEIMTPEEVMYNGHSIGIDVGVNNLITVVDNRCTRPFIINGRPLKAINQYFNKERAYYQSILEQMNGCKKSKRIDKFMEKRDRQINDYLHKTSRYLIKYCVEHNVTQIIIGKNINWKQHSNLGKRANQNFVQIPVARLIKMISYKAKEYGIAIKMTEESYTSGTSFIDNEEPTRENYNKRRRVYRGLFYSNSGIYINADVNGAYQIMKKVIPMQRDSGCVLHPLVVCL